MAAEGTVSTACASVSRRSEARCSANKAMTDPCTRMYSIDLTCLDFRITGQLIKAHHRQDALSSLH